MVAVVPDFFDQHPDFPAEAAAANEKLATQLPLDDKKARATWVIDNSGTPEQTRAQVKALWATLTSPA